MKTTDEAYAQFNKMRDDRDQKFTERQAFDEVMAERYNDGLNDGLVNKNQVAERGAGTGHAINLMKLKALAHGATPGPWWASKHEDWFQPQTRVHDEKTAETVTFYNGRPEYDQFMFCGTRGKAEREWANAEFIAAANPVVIIDMIALIERQEAELSNGTEHRAHSVAPRRASKVGGSYQAEGSIVSTFTTLAGETRHVFEFDSPAGMLHIFSPGQVVIDEAPLVAAQSTRDAYEAAYPAAKLAREGDGYGGAFAGMWAVWQAAVASVGPAGVEQVDVLSDVTPLLYYRADADGSICWDEDCVCADPVYDHEDSTEQRIYSGKAYSEAQVRAILAAAQPVAPVQAAPEGKNFADGIEVAAAWIDRRREDFETEHGIVDWSTGTLEYGTGAHAEAKREYSGELAEIAEGIRALAVAPALASPA